MKIEYDRVLDDIEELMLFLVVCGNSITDFGVFFKGAYLSQIWEIQYILKYLRQEFALKYSRSMVIYKPFN